MKKNIAVAVLSTTLTVLILEAVFRIIPNNELNRYLRFINYKGNPAVSYRPSDVTGYELIPNSSPQVNSLGMFDKEYTVKKKKGAYRILILGDSITANNLYPSMLEDMLNQFDFKNSRFEVLNAALPGIGVRQYLNYLEKKGAGFSPDMVLIGFCINDFEVWSPIVYKDKNNLIEYYNPFPRLSRYCMNKFLFRHSALYRFLVIRLENIFYAEYRNAKDSLADRKEEGLYCLKKMKDNCGKKNIMLAGVIFPYLKPLIDYDIYEIRMYNDIKETLGDLNINYLDLHPYFYGLDLYSLRETPEDFVHPNTEGHKIAAESIFRYLKKIISGTGIDNDR